MVHHLYMECVPSTHIPSTSFTTCLIPFPLYCPSDPPFPSGKHHSVVCEFLLMYLFFCVNLLFGGRVRSALAGGLGASSQAEVV